MQVNAGREANLSQILSTALLSIIVAIGVSSVGWRKCNLRASGERRTRGRL
jgi:hypothetical protein